MTEEISFDDLDLDLNGPLPVAGGKAVRRYADADPIDIALYPATFPVEIALQTAPLPDILASYAIDLPRWEALQKHPVFVRDLGAALEAVKKHGMTFKMKAGLQAEAMLERMWEMAHSPYDEVPPAVQADLMKFVVKAAGLDASKDQAGNQQVTPLQININLG